METYFLLSVQWYKLRPAADFRLSKMSGRCGTRHSPEKTPGRWAGARHAAGTRPLPVAASEGRPLGRKKETRERKRENMRDSPEGLAALAISQD